MNDVALHLGDCTKVCNKCKAEKPLSPDYFWRHASNPDGYNNLCKQCKSSTYKPWAQENRLRRNAMAATWRASNPERRRNTMLKCRNGITLETYSTMLHKQGSCCKICATPSSEFRKALHVDHCHKSGKIRGLLCVDCNRLIGAAKDEVNILKGAIQYLLETSNG